MTGLFGDEEGARGGDLLRVGEAAEGDMSVRVEGVARYRLAGAHWGEVSTIRPPSGRCREAWSITFRVRAGVADVDLDGDGGLSGKPA
ncbi:hypothetical protein [Streptomyces scabichelini]|uniref:hypothetical protein n=1 Tax=Streptomyces scabichelini TaxID=2711217 RepID=UPI0019D10808|nr:hypothetical protein [Streptomyces scabichelini]